MISSSNRYTIFDKYELPGSVHPNTLPNLLSKLMMYKITDLLHISSLSTAPKFRMPTTSVFVFFQRVTIPVSAIKDSMHMVTDPNFVGNQFYFHCNL